MKTESEKIIYTIHEVAKMLRVSPNYVYSLIDNGYLPAIKLKSVKILKSSFEKFLLENEGKDLSDLNNAKQITHSSMIG